ncbi:hypothetical protein Q5H91_02510 [Sphingomonas sp. KR1UV-12]|uniref:WYL domain-containing protein n=1 Tax=Sphingomonas aurea TaxID=3063994 RepID=A0ABT9EH23_9SPHN|nr:hypothetical protein [Sphingomonas sp. KR1UV-12]MDP1026071.1 hypothetical protein [Sphingomonas sp. KR1UV-12]
MITTADRAATLPPPSPAIVFEAIVKQLAVAASYNRGEVTLAPHVIYTRHDEIYVDAVTLERDGKPPKEEKMGSFKLAGLAGLRVTPRRFSPHSLYNPGEKRYAGTVLMAVEIA